MNKIVMDNTLNQRWKAAGLPFNGLTIAFASEELTPLPALRQVLLSIVPALQERWPQAGLFMLDDWHEHDGYVNVAKATTWPELSARLGSDKTAIAFTHGDFAVRLAFFPDDYGFYLRVYVPADVVDTLRRDRARKRVAEK